MQTRTRDWHPHWLAAAMLLALSQGVSGAEFKSGEIVTIGEHDVVRDDLYMTGDTMTVKGTVIGDVVASGRLIFIEGRVEGDLIAAAQAIVIQGEVTDDVRIAGMTLKLVEGASVGDDVFVAGFSFESQKGSRVTGKTGITGYQAVLGGEHRQGVEASLVALQLDGVVQGDVDATVDSEAAPAWWTRFMRSPVALPTVAPGLTVADGARVEGSLEYRSAAAARIGAEAVISGEVRHVQPEIHQEDEPTVASRIGTALRWLVVLFLFGATLLWLIPTRIGGAVEILRLRPVASLGWGLVTLLGFPVAAILILVLTSVLTMAFGMLSLSQGATLVLVGGLLTCLVLMAVLWMAALYLAPVTAALAAGRRLMSRDSGEPKRRYLALLLGLILLSALGLIPFLGVVVKGLVVIVGLGASALWGVRHLARVESPGSG